MLRDVPIKKTKDEHLGLISYASALSNFIYTCETPVTIGIQGDWGIGKTSLLNLITENLNERRPRFYSIKIETWQYALFTGEEYISFSIINAINQELLKLLHSERIDTGHKQSFFKDFARFGFSMVDQLVSSKTGMSIKEAATADDKVPLDFQDMAEAISTYKREFVELLELLIPSRSNETMGRYVTERKLVIMLDDLDRIKPIRALELLEAIKNFLDIPKCVFVLAVDYSVIEQGMEEKLGKSSKDFYGKSFFDKIIQIPFNMPVASYRTDRYIMAMLGLDYADEKKMYYRNKERIPDEAAFLSYSGISNYTPGPDSSFKNLTGLSQNQADYYASIVEIAAKNNPRSIKRLVNYSNLLKLICRTNGLSWSQLNAQIVFSIAAMQLTWPEIFNYFAANPSPGVFQQMEDMNYLAEIKEARPLYARAKDEQEVQSRIAAFFDHFLMLIDGEYGDGDGQISTSEFLPIWEVLKKANLTNAKLEDTEEQWAEFEKVIFDNLEKTNYRVRDGWDSINGILVKDKSNSKVNNILTAFKESKWNNQLYFRLLDAGKSYRNIVWGKKQIGSLVSTKGDVMTLYLNEAAIFGPQEKDYLERFVQQMPSEYQVFIDKYEASHYGNGKLKVDLLGISRLGSKSDAVEILNYIIEVIKKYI